MDPHLHILRSTLSHLGLAGVLLNYGFGLDPCSGRLRRTKDQRRCLMIYSGSTHDSSSLTCITRGPELIFDIVVLACEGLGGQ